MVIYFQSLKKFRYLVYLSFFFVSCSKETNSVNFNYAKFEDALRSNDAHVALNLLDSYQLSNGHISLNGEYFRLCESEKISVDYLKNEAFNEVDFFFWRQSAYLKTVAQDLLTANTGRNPVEVLLYAAFQTLEAPGDREDVNSFPVHIWNRKFGYCDRQAWVLSEMLYQVGFETAIIYLVNDDGVSPHTICEARYKDQKFLLDPLWGKILPNVSLDTITDEQIKLTWENQPEYHNGFEKAFYLIHSLPCDYSLRHKKIQSLKGLSFRSGEDPLKRKGKWLSKKHKVKLWPIPFRILGNYKPYNDVFE